MENKYEIRYLPLFQEDFMEIIDYISVKLKNPAAAEHLIDAVEKAIYDRSFCAESFAPYRSQKKRKFPYYQIFVRNYTIFYIVVDGVMEVHRILYSRRNMASLI